LKVKKVIKRIVALGTGFSMLGATMFGALAADLADFPAPYVKNAVYDAKIVIGEAAAPSDVIASIDIANRLQFSMTKEATVSGGTSVSMTGDSKKLEQSTNKLELNEKMNDPTSGLSVLSAITSSDLKALADGSIDNDFGTFKYTQVIDVPEAQVVYESDPDNLFTEKDDLPAEYLKFPTAKFAYTYKISFSPALKSDHNTGSNGYLEDVKGKKLTLLGKEYKILKANHQTGNSISLTLMAGAQTDILEEGATKTYTISGKDYEVTASTITTSEVQFVINNELTSTLTEGDTYKLTDGTEIGVSDIMENEAGEAAGGDKTEFSIGAQKVVIDDTSTGNKAFDATVTIGSEELSYVKGDIITSSDGGTASGADVKISDIKIQYNASQSLYIPKGKGLSEVADKVEGETGNVFLNGFDITFEGFETPVTEEIRLSPSGTNAYKLSWKNKNGQEYNEEVFANSGSTVQLGAYSGGYKPLVLNESGAIAKNDYFIVSKNAYSHIMKFTSFNTANNVTKIKDTASGGSTYEVTMTATGGGSTGNLNLDGNTFKLNASASGDQIFVDMDGSGAVDATGVVGEGAVSGGVTTDCPGTPSSSYGLVTQYEACLSFEIATTQLANVTIRLTTEKTENTKYNTTSVTMKWDSSNSRLDITNLSGLPWDFGAAGGIQVDDETNYEFYDGFGTKGYWKKPTTGQQEFKWTYPDSQVTGAVFYKSGVTSSSATGGVKTAEIVRIDVGAAVLDTDPSVLGKETTQNVIAVGGPAVNRAAAVLLGKTYPSYGAASGIPENAAVVKLVENGANVGMVVAGWSAQDTQRASRVVANYDKYANFKGKEVKVTGTSLTDMVVSAVV